MMMEFRKTPLRLLMKRRLYQSLLVLFLAWFFLCKLTNYGVLVCCKPPSVREISYMGFGS